MSPVQVAELSPEAVQSRVDDVHGTVHKLGKALPEDAVVARLKRTLEAFKEQLPLLTEARTLSDCM